jgi:hypothetical protein
MSHRVTVATALLVATLCTVTATALHVGNASRAAPAVDVRAELQKRATELHRMALADVGQNRKVHAE